MITKLPNVKNGYYIDEHTRNIEWQAFIENYEKTNEVHCIICNSEMAKHFRVGAFRKNNITINNSVLDNIIFINSFT